MTEEEAIDQTYGCSLTWELRNQAAGAAAGPDKHWTAPELLREAAEEIIRLRMAMYDVAEDIEGGDTEFAHLSLRTHADAYDDIKNMRAELDQLPTDQPSR